MDLYDINIMFRKQFSKLPASYRQVKFMPSMEMYLMYQGVVIEMDSLVKCQIVTLMQSASYCPPFLCIPSYAIIYVPAPTGINCKGSYCFD